MQLEKEGKDRRYIFDDLWLTDVLIVGNLQELCLGGTARIHVMPHTASFTGFALPYIHTDQLPHTLMDRQRDARRESDIQQCEYDN